MPGSSDLIRELHRLHRFSHELKEEIERFPRQTQIQQIRVKKVEETLHEQQEALKKLKVGIHENEVTVKSMNAQIRKHEEQLGGVGSKKEYDALVSEIKHDRQSVQQLEEQILLAMTEIDDLTPKLPEFEQAVAKAKEEFAKWQKEARTHHEKQVAQLAETQTKLKDAESKLPDKLRALYQRVVSSMGSDSMAAVRNRSCSACRTAITAQNQNELLQGRMLECKSCGRLLYMPEEATPLV
jgi:predicted  nucleic acid-binding Zn-ribbon protein